VIIMAFFIAGCSSYGVVYGPGGDDFPPAVDWTEIVESGERVRVTLEDERLVEGKVMDLSTDTLVVETKVWAEDTTSDPYKSSTTIEIVTIAAGEDIRSIEVPKFSLVKTLVLIGAIAAPIVVIALTAENPMDIGGTGFQ